MIDEIGVLQNFITNLGFPIMVALFVLYKLNHSLEKLRDSVDKLCSEMNDREVLLKELVLKVEYLEKAVYRNSGTKRRTKNQ
jgi:hypothetical protein